MNLILSGEDGHTFFALTNEDILDEIQKDLQLISIDKIWFRPSFGRGAGIRKKIDEKGYSGFGECDALIEGLDQNGRRNFVFVESKGRDPFQSEVMKKELRYQFFLKFALVNAMYVGAVIKRFGEAKRDAEYFLVELPEKEPKLKVVSTKLLDYYRAYKANYERTNGWLLKKDSPDAPALKSIQEALISARAGLRFRFLALGFVENGASSVSRQCALFDGLALTLNDTISDLFYDMFELHVLFRNVVVDRSHKVPVPIRY